jgi:hypothetical protein
MKVAGVVMVVAGVVLGAGNSVAQSYGDRLAGFTRIYEAYVHNLSQLRLCRQGVPELSDQVMRAFVSFQDANGRMIEEITEKMKAEAKESGGGAAVKRFESIRQNIIKDKEDWARKDYEAVSVARALSFCDRFSKTVIDGKRVLVQGYRNDYDAVMGRRAAR